MATGMSAFRFTFVMVATPPADNAVPATRLAVAEKHTTVILAGHSLDTIRVFHATQSVESPDWAARRGEGRVLGGPRSVARECDHPGGVEVSARCG